MKKVLVLGAGLVSRPLVRYLLEVPDCEVTVATRTVSKADKLIAGHPHGRAVALNVENEAELRHLVSQCDLAISLLPYIHHVKVANLCVELKKHMVTTSYISPAMKALEKSARTAGILILNEIGVDPGIDHMSAMRIIHSVEKKGGKVVSFKSYCGGLPAPEANTNPFGYKFSWSPRGVLMAGRNDAKYLEDGKIIEVPGKELFKNRWPLTVENMHFETYPNRNSLPYLETYGLKSARTMFRGTIRNVGWCDTLFCIAKLGLLSDEKRADLAGSTFDGLIRKLVSAKAGESTPQALRRFLGADANDKVIADLEWLGLTSNEALPETDPTLLDVMTTRFLTKMPYGENERDMLVLYHEFIAEYPDKKEKITSTLIDFGIPGGDSSMARTVSLPAAIATRLILEGKINLTGVLAPVMPEIYNPVLSELESLDIICRERTFTL
ncbi:MAG: saccharopine dehydrogenase C-terminal domain-containing protein [Candidatus Marinimicrobia bacterium]|nr:saccharopine dehydrogenase C-terminal domain-containing protein [Candidatus Neomarinimicrobiota bacterium]